MTWNVLQGHFGPLTILVWWLGVISCDWIFEGSWLDFLCHGWWIVIEIIESWLYFLSHGLVYSSTFHSVFKYHSLGIWSRFDDPSYSCWWCFLLLFFSGKLGSTSPLFVWNLEGRNKPGILRDIGPGLGLTTHLTRVDDVSCYYFVWILEGRNEPGILRDIGLVGSIYSGIKGHGKCLLWDWREQGHHLEGRGRATSLRWLWWKSRSSLMEGACQNS